MRIAVLFLMTLGVLAFSPHLPRAQGQITGSIIGISPDPFTFELTAGGQAQASVTVAFTVPQVAPIDVLFLTDTTNSMEEFIEPIQTAYRVAARGLANNESLDLQFAFADYKDFGSGDSYDDRGYRIAQKFTPEFDEALAGINDMFIGGGNGGPEQNLAALTQIGRDWFDLGGRRGAQKHIVWLGDAPGFEDFGPYPSLSETMRSLTDIGAQVFAFNPFKAGLGLDAPGVGPTASERPQASTIVEATGGLALNNVPLGNADILSNLIENAVEQASTVLQISLEVDGDLGGWQFITQPIEGPFEPSDEPYFETFQLTIAAPDLIELVQADLIFKADGMSLDRLSETQQQFMQFIFACILGDMNGDSLVDAFDVGLFELALADQVAYEALVPIDADEWGDLDGNGVLDAFDVGVFESVLVASGAGIPVHAPEPGSLICFVSLLATFRRRATRRAA